MVPAAEEGLPLYPKYNLIVRQNKVSSLTVHALPHNGDIGKDPDDNAEHFWTLLNHILAENLAKGPSLLFGGFGLSPIGNRWV